MGRPNPKLTLPEFLAWENEQPERHEFVRGEIFAMVGGRRIHNQGAGNVFRRPTFEGVEPETPA